MRQTRFLYFDSNLEGFGRIYQREGARSSSGAKTSSLVQGAVRSSDLRRLKRDKKNRDKAEIDSARAKSAIKGLGMNSLANRINDAEQGKYNKNSNSRAKSALLRLMRKLKLQNKKAMEAVEKSKTGKHKALTPLRLATSRILVKAWLSAETILGFVFIGLPWINIHVFLRLCFGTDAFCKLGHEWLDNKSMGRFGGSEMSAYFKEVAGNKIGVVEVMVVLLCDLIVILAILLIILIIFLIVGLVGAVADALS